MVQSYEIVGNCLGEGKEPARKRARVEGKGRVRNFFDFKPLCELKTERRVVSLGLAYFEKKEANKLGNFVHKERRPLAFLCVLQ